MCEDGSPEAWLRANTVTPQDRREDRLIDELEQAKCARDKARAEVARLTGLCIATENGRRLEVADLKTERDEARALLAAAEEALRLGDHDCPYAYRDKERQVGICGLCMKRLSHPAMRRAMEKKE